jgi:hypothetical protein
VERALGLRLVNGLGSSEASNLYLSDRPGHPRPGTVGWPVPGYQLRLQPAGDEDPRAGELLVRGPTVMVGYDSESAIRTGVVRDGWLSSGDVLRREDDGSYTYLRRAGDRFKAGAPGRRGAGARCAHPPRGGGRCGGPAGTRPGRPRARSTGPSSRGASKTSFPARAASGEPFHERPRRRPPRDLERLRLLPARRNEGGEDGRRGQRFPDRDLRPASGLDRGTCPAPRAFPPRRRWARLRTHRLPLTALSSFLPPLAATPDPFRGAAAAGARRLRSIAVNRSPARVHAGGGPGGSPTCAPATAR